MAIGPGRHAPGHGVGELIGRAGHEGVEGEAVLKAAGARNLRESRRRSGRRIAGDRIDDLDLHDPGRRRLATLGLELEA